MSEEKLLDLLKKKRGFFEAILELTESETLLSLDEWISTLNQKKVLLGCIEKIDEELALFKDSLEIISQEIIEEIDSIKSVVQEILYIDTLQTERRRQTLRVDENS